MNLVNPKAINPQLNKCYMEYDPTWPDDSETRVPAFKYYIERIAGLKLDFTPKVDYNTGRFGYELREVEIIDDRKYTMFLLKYS
jgi:hypothetical protein